MDLSIIYLFHLPILFKFLSFSLSWNVILIFQILDVSLGSEGFSAINPGGKFDEEIPDDWSVDFNLF